MQASDLAGKWTYRSFRNNPAPVDGDLENLSKLLFAEAEFTFAISGNSLTGVIDWGSNGLDLTGTIHPATADAPLKVEIVGLGRANPPPSDPASTAGWEYDYYAYAAHEWPTGVNQVPALVGSVIRAKPHGSAPAGYSASFIAVKKP